MVVLVVAEEALAAPVAPVLANSVVCKVVRPPFRSLVYEGRAME